MNELFSTIMSIIRSITGRYRTSGDVTTLESKKILISAIFAEQQGAYLNTLTMGIGNRMFSLLSDWWGIDERDEALETFDFLENKVYAYYFPTVCEAWRADTDEEREEIILSAMTTDEDAEKAYEQTNNLLIAIDKMKALKLIESEADVEKIGVTGWDAGRLAFMARLCFDAGYITEAEAWRYIDAAYKMAHQRFRSWDEFAKSYVLGRFIWADDESNEFIKQIADDLINKPHSPWKKVPWD